MKNRFVLMVVLYVIPLYVSPVGAEEILDWELNREVTKADQGFPWSYAPLSNFDWTAPVNYAQGTVHVRMEIRSCAGSGQDIFVQVCYHQLEDLSRESCGSGRSFRTFTSGSPVIFEWSEPLTSWWQYSAIDWSEPRERIMAAIKKGTTSGGTPISDICCNWNWAGLDPDDIYPIDMRLTVVLVSAGSTFGGWQPYVDGTALPPRMNLSLSAISFIGLEGGPDPAARGIMVTNSSLGTLDPVTATVEYNEGDDWLSVTCPTEPGNEQPVITNAHTDGLEAGIYSATVTLTCANAEPSQSAYTVYLNLRESTAVTREPGLLRAGSFIETHLLRGNNPRLAESLEKGDIDRWRILDSRGREVTSSRNPTGTSLSSGLYLFQAVARDGEVMESAIPVY